VNIKGAIITIDAMGAQKEIAAQIVDGEGDYVPALQGNQGTLHQAVIDDIDEQLEGDLEGAQEHVTVEKGHGREETRTYLQFAAPERLPGFGLWKALRTIAVVTSLCVRDGKETAEVRYYISSLTMDVKRLARAVRGHWGIENGCHWVLDVTYREDESRIREETLRENFAWLNRFTLSLLKQHLDRTSIAMKRRSCGWNDDYLMQVLPDQQDSVRWPCAAPDLHLIFGWLRVGCMLRPTSEPGSIPRWAAEHPHVFRARNMAVNNTLYVASRGLRLPTVPGSIPGGGVFLRQALILTLTVLAQGRSFWRLPGWFYPTAGKPALSYHSDPRRWKRDGADCYVQSVGRGQEFVLDCDHFPEAFDWLRDLFAEVTGSCADQAGGKRRMRQVSS
jgi:predicted transposase YbfD/YdcC